MPELKPCPFCGEDAAEPRYGSIGYTSPNYYPYERGWVECSKCRCGTAKRFYMIDAISDWNRRPEDG